MRTKRYLHPAVLLSVAWLLQLACPPQADAEDEADRLLREAVRAARSGDSARAVELATAAVERDRRLAAAYYLRGREQFRLGKVKESVADFDRYVELVPDAKPRQWERGIACYYAGQFQKGADQFELYQTFHDNDVENSVWRYLCMVPTTGVEKARDVMLPIKNDRRVPMMEIYDLYRGKLQPADVLAAARRGAPEPQMLAGRLFYAHLYLGLFHEAAGNHAEARTFIMAAADPQLADNPHINGYMWDVARVHAARRKAAKDAGKAAKDAGQAAKDAGKSP